MADIGNDNQKWVRVQKKAFTRWMNQYLFERMLSVEDIQTELCDGVLLINLLEIISRKQMPKKWRSNPGNDIVKKENLNTALEFIKSEGLKLVNIGSSDVFEGNLRIILGLIWTLILRYQIQTGIEEGSPKWILLEWVRKQVKPYSVPEPQNFTNTWQDGQVLTALCDSLEPGKCTLAETDPEEHPVDDLARAIKVAEDEYQIKPLLDAIDINQTPDEHSIMAYVSYFRDYVEKNEELLATPAASYTTADGPGVEGGRARVRNPIYIRTKNCKGDPTNSSGHAGLFFVDIKGPAYLKEEIQPEPIKDLENGDYETAYVPEKAGRYIVSVKIKGQDIHQSPFDVLFEGSSAANTWAEGPGLVGGRTGKDLPFTIHGIDADGKPCAEDGTDPYTIKITGPDGEVVPTLTDKGDGDIDVVYQVENPGDYDIAIDLNGIPIKDSPFKAHIEPAVDLERTYAEGPGLEGAKDNEPAKFKVYAFDNKGEPVPDQDIKLLVEPLGDNAGGAVPETKVTDNGDGTYDCEYNPEVAGPYKITAQLDGNDIKGTPVTIDCIEGATDTANISYTINVHAKNKAGELKTSGGDDFKVYVCGDDESAEVESVAKDNEDGTYSAMYSLEGEQGAKFKVYIKLNGRDIKGSPFKHVL